MTDVIKGDTLVFINQGTAGLLIMGSFGRLAKGRNPRSAGPMIGDWKSLALELWMVCLLASSGDELVLERLLHIIWMAEMGQDRVERK
jgi:hypothetical protein